MRRGWAAVIGCALVLLAASPADARSSKAETAFLAKVHKQNLFPNASDAQLVRSGHAFCRLARDVGFTEAYLELDHPEYAAKTSASFFLLDTAAVQTLCPKIKRK